MNEVPWIQSSGCSPLCHSSKKKMWFVLQVSEFVGGLVGNNSLAIGPPSLKSFSYTHS